MTTARSSRRPATAGSCAARPRSMPKARRREPRDRPGPRASRIWTSWPRRAAGASRGPGGWRGRRTGPRRASGCWASWRSWATLYASTATRPATSGRRSTATTPTAGFVIVGSHIDAVPSGGWLDGALGLLTALEVLRTLALSGDAPGGRASGSSTGPTRRARASGARWSARRAVAGTLDPDDVRGLLDAGRRSTLQDAMASRRRRPRRRGRGAVAGWTARAPTWSCTSSRARSCWTPAGWRARSSGTFGDERYLIAFTGQSAHAGSTPMHLRRDTLAAAATAALEIREVGIRHGGVTTVGAITSSPAVITAIAGESEMMLDLRHLDADTLATMLAECLDACERAAAHVRLRRGAAARVRRDADAVPPQVGRARQGGGRRGGRRRRRADPVRAAARRDRDRPARARP